MGLSHNHDYGNDENCYNDEDDPYNDDVVVDVSVYDCDG